MIVKRLYRTLPTTPEAAYEAAWKVQLMCEVCMVPRNVRFSMGGRWSRYWTQDFETIFAKVRFKCRCGKFAHALRVSRRTRDDSETILLISRRVDTCGWLS